MSDHPAHLPAREVIRFGLQVILRLVVATIAGLIILKVGVVALEWAAEEAILNAKISTAVVFLGWVMLRPIPLPEIDYGPDREESLIDEK